MTRFIYLVFFCFLSSCEVRNSPIKLDILPLPEGGTVNQIAMVDSGDAGPISFALAANKIFRRDSDGWSQISEDYEFINEGTTLVGVGAFLYAFSPSTFDKSNTLSRSADGIVWEDIRLPKKIRFMRFRKTKGNVRSKTFRVVDDIQLSVFEDSLTLIHPQNIWRGYPGREGVKWNEVDLEGLPFGVKRDTRLPPSIRNYLPASEFRSFELATVLTEQLLIFRRERDDQGWVLVSSLPTADLELASVPSSDTVFIVSDNAIYRSNDRGDEWFQFQPPSTNRIKKFLGMPNQQGGFLMLVGTDNGEIWKSEEEESWEIIRKGDVDQRSILSLIANGKIIHAGTEGNGVLISRNWGRTFETDNDGLNAAAPSDTIIFDGSPVVSTNAGVFRWDGSSWKAWSLRDTTVLKKSSGQMIVGTQNGDILTGDFEQGASILTPQFGEAKLRFENGRSSTSELSITHISAANSGRVIAWSKNRGAVSNLGQSSNWQVLPIVSQFEELLSRGSIVEFDIAANAFFIVEEADSMFRLWRSDAQAKSWTEVNRFENTSKISIGGSSRTSESLILIDDGKLKLTSDGGLTWDIIRGPWQAHQIVGSQTFDKDKLSVLVRTSRRLELYTIDRVTQNPVFEFHPLVGTNDIGAGVLFSSEKESIVLASNRAVYFGGLEVKGGTFSFGSSMFVTGLLSLLFAGMAFIFVRIFLAARAVRS